MEMERTVRVRLTDASAGLVATSLESFHILIPPVQMSHSASWVRLRVP